MTRKDYTKFAEIIRKGKLAFASKGHWHAVDFFEKSITELLAADNPQFDRERFSAACTVHGAEELP